MNTAYIPPHPLSTISPQAPNRMNMIAENPSREELARYRNATRDRALYKAASLLWSKGIPMEQAISIVDGAMTEAGE